MKLVTMRLGDATRAGRVEKDTVVELAEADVSEILAAGESGLLTAADHRGRVHDRESVELAPVIPRPGKIVCVGLNYRGHIEEMGRMPDTHPTLFATFAEALIGHRDPIVMPASTDALDWEVELAAVIGRSVRNADRAEAAEAIAGYTVYNDVSARDWQSRTTQWLQGKTFEKTSPLGPMLVTKDEVGDDPALEIRCAIDGTEVQHSSTGDLVFPPSVVVSYLSSILTLQPGDVVATGTPNGVGAGLDPPRYLELGNVVTSSIEGIGILENPVEQ